MASGFSSQCTCEGRQCASGEDAPVATYLVNETQELCEVCAKEKSSAQSVVPLIQGGRGRLFYCAKHEGKLGENFCITHNVLVCRPCAIASHQKPCKLMVTEDALEHKSESLKQAFKDALRRMEDMRHQDAAVNKKVSGIKNRFQTLETEIRKSSEEALEKITKQRQDRDTKIKQDADDKVQVIIRHRDQSLRKSGETAKEEEENNEKETIELVGRLRSIEQDFCSPSLQELSADFNKFFDDAGQVVSRAELLLGDTDQILAEGKRMENSLRIIADAFIESLSVENAFDIAECVSYCKDPVAGLGTINLAGNRLWKLKNTIHIPHQITRPRVGFAGNNMVLIHDIESKYLYSVDIQTGTTKSVESNVNDFAVWGDGRSATLSTVGDNVYVTSTIHVNPLIMNKKSFSITEFNKNKHTGINEELSKYPKIEMNTRLGALVKVLPRKIHHADLLGQRITHEISIRVKEIHDMVQLPHGDILVKAAKDKFIVVDAEGKKKYDIHRPYWDKVDVSIDRISGALYFVYLNERQKRVSMDRIDIDPETGPRFEKVLTTPIRLDPNKVTHCAVYDARKMCICNGNRLYIFNSGVDESTESKSKTKSESR